MPSSPALVRGVAAISVLIVAVTALTLGGCAVSARVPVAGPPSRSASNGADTLPALAASPRPCAVTRPEPVFMPPAPFLPTPPASYDGSWYGTAHLWTMLHPRGEVWGPWVRQDSGLPQKTFWWSSDWVPQDELQPAITVTGRRLDASGSFRFGDPGTNATADFGTAMLVGIDIPDYGCWQITARYRDASLSYVVSVVDH
jgi:hypothetical protein